MDMNILKKGDVVLIGVLTAVIVILLIGISIYKNSGENTHKLAIIKINDTVIKEIDLDTVIEPMEIELSGAYNEVILVEKGRIKFKEADCPDKLCVEFGWLSEKGDMAVCIPNSALIKIEGTTKKVDAVTN